MSAPLSNKDCIIAIFDSFAKTVMKNECRDAVEQEKRKRQKEQTATEKMQYLFETQVQEDVYPSEHLVLQGKSHICVITCELLYNAMLKLTETQREVLILDFWYGYTDIEIAAQFQVTPRTIYNWRQKAFAAIRNYYERNHYERK